MTPTVRLAFAFLVRPQLAENNGVVARQRSLDRSRATRLRRPRSHRERRNLSTRLITHLPASPRSLVAIGTQTNKNERLHGDELKLRSKTPARLRAPTVAVATPNQNLLSLPLPGAQPALPRLRVPHRPNGAPRG